MCHILLGSSLVDNQPNIPPRPSPLMGRSFLLMFGPTTLGRRGASARGGSRTGEGAFLPGGMSYGGISGGSRWHHCAINGDGHFGVINALLIKKTILNMVPIREGPRLGRGYLHGHGTPVEGQGSSRF